MEEEKSASHRVIESWGGEFISTDRIKMYEEMVKEDGDPWTPTYITVMEKYHNTQCPFCGVTGAFKYHLFGRLHCTQCGGEFKVTIGEYIHRNLVKKMLNTTLDAFAEGFFAGIFILFFMIPIRFALTLIGLPFILIPHNKPPEKTVNSNYTKVIDEMSAAEYFLQISQDNKYNTAEEMVSDFIKYINKQYLNDTFISEWASRYIEYCKGIGEKTYIEAQNISETVLKEYLSLLDRDASWEEQSSFLEKNGINIKKMHIDTITNYSIDLYRAIT